MLQLPLDPTLHWRDGPDVPPCSISDAPFTMFPNPSVEEPKGYGPLFLSVLHLYRCPVM